MIQPNRPRFRIVEPTMDELHAIARDYAALYELTTPQMAAFAEGREFNMEKLHMECVFAHGVTISDRPDGASPAGESYVDWLARMRVLETWARRELRRQEYRYRIDAAVAGLAEFGVPVEDVQALVEHAYARGARNRP